jgi:hypothetical protein
MGIFIVWICYYGVNVLGIGLVANPWVFKADYPGKSRIFDVTKAVSSDH